MSDYHPHIHELKTHPQYYHQIHLGAKRFELRRDDRGGFQVGDLLILREWDEHYTGYVTVAVVTYVLGSGEWLAPGYVALGIAVMEAHDV